MELFFFLVAMLGWPVELRVEVRDSEVWVIRDGNGYQLTHNGKEVAHVGWIPHFAPPNAQSNYLQVDNTTIYPLPKGDETYRAEGSARSATSRSSRGPDLQRHP